MSKESEALKDEATEGPKPVEFEFDGHKYAVRPNQPSPKAMEYLADYLVKSSIYAVPFIREAIGQNEWDLWCERHQTSQVSDMVTALDGAFSGNS